VSEAPPRASAPLAAVIVGGGFAGIGMAIRLKQAGIHDFLLLEREAGIGGTWRDNTYPNAACDVPSVLYSFSFEPGFPFPRFYARQPDILRYQRHCVSKHGIEPHLRLNCGVRTAHWDGTAACWRIHTLHGEVISARALITATGQLSVPRLPDIAGLASFTGPCLHSARWDPGVDLQGRRVAVIGTGASAAQLLPQAVSRATRVTLFQRTPPYVLPRPDRPAPRWESWLYGHVPPLRWLSRGTVFAVQEFLGLSLYALPVLGAVVRQLCLAHLWLRVRDPALRRKLTPSYALGCKRILVDNGFYGAVTQPHCEVVTEAIASVGPDHVRTVDGGRHEADVLVLATGFASQTFNGTFEIAGRDGRTLSEAWREGAYAYRGVTVHGFPNLFMLYGPNTNLGHNSILYMTESQIGYVLGALRALRAAPGEALEVLPEAESQWNARLQQALGRTVWSTGGCGNWYQGPGGRITSNWSGSTFSYRGALRRFDAEHYARLAPR